VPVVVLLERTEEAVSERAQDRRGDAGEQQLVQRRLWLGSGVWARLRRLRRQSSRWHLKELPDPHTHLQLATALP
jgi:hypothetical protein